MIRAEMSRVVSGRLVGERSECLPKGGAGEVLSERLLARNALFNFAGMATPMLAGLFAIPYLIEGMGKERFGLLAIIWMGVGYFSLFDLGLARSLTKLVADRLGRKDDADLPELIWTALWLIVLLGIIGTIVILVFVKPIIYQLLNVSASLRIEGVRSFQLLAFSLPIVTATSALIGILEAHQQFAKIAAVRIPLGVMTFLGPVLSLHFSPSLVWATTALITARGVAFVFYYAQAARLNGALTRPRGLAQGHLRPLFSFGGWLTVSNIVGPLMVYFDRFLIGAILGMTAVTYYITPYEVLSRLQMLPQAVMGVLFPAFATVIVSDRERLPQLYSRATRIIFLLMLPIMSIIFLYAPEVLQLWLGDDFRVAATPVAQLFALGWMINFLARSPFTVLQSSGCPELIAKAHLLELIPYGLALWLLTQKFGISGAAAAWVLRVLVDTIVLNELARRELPELHSEIRWAHIMIFCLLIGFSLATLLQSIILRALLWIAIITASGIVLRSTLKCWRDREIKPTYSPPPHENSL